MLLVLRLNEEGTAVAQVAELVVGNVAIRGVRELRVQRGAFNEQWMEIFENCIPCRCFQNKKLH